MGITTDAVTKSYLGTLVLDRVSVQVPPGSLTVLTGPSGSGKTTLLNLVSTLDLPDAGTIVVGGTEVSSLSRRDRDRFRARNGYVFQRSGLLRGLTVRENIHAGHELTGQRVDAAWTGRLVERLGLADVLDVPASRVSGGQAQRTALVRALAHRPAYLFADEPTASLDTVTTRDIHELLHDVARDGTTVLMVSHDELSTTHADTVLRLVDGQNRSENEAHPCPPT